CDEQASSPVDQFVAQLLHSLGRIANREMSYYLPIRRELIAWMLAPVPEALHERAAAIAEELTGSFRRRLGNRQTRAVDPESGRSYTWADTLRFEEGIDADELDRITGALCHTNLVREAVLVLHQNRKINLDSLAPGNIWISMIRTRFGRGVYHVGVRLRSGERCDFMLYVRNTAPLDTFLTDLYLMCLAAGIEGETPLTPQLGGYWPEYGIATVSYIPAESIEALVRHMHEHPDHEVRQRLRASWHHLCWSALAAAFEFHRRTERRWVLTGSLARVISVTLDDFDEDARVFSVAGWHPFAGRLGLLLHLKRGFLERIRFHFPELATETHDKILFAAALEVFGLREGVAFLEEAAAEPDDSDAPADELDELRRMITEYTSAIRESGYMPKALHFAIARYRAWAEQVPESGVQARAAQLRQLENNYHIEALTRRFPESRLWLYADTVLQDSPVEGRQTIAQAMNRLREGGGIKEVLGRLYQDLRSKLPRHDQQYFLTRAAYPHLELDEKAELITTSEVGPSRAELVTLHKDRLGGTQRIRPAANAREVDRLYRIFYTGGLGGGYREQEKLLIALDEAEYVIGGVAYIRRTPNHVLLERIAILPRCRGRGVGQLLINEFLRRQRADGVSVVSAEFIRATWLAQFGFKFHPRYAGVVCEIRSKDQPTEPVQPSEGPARDPEFGESANRQAIQDGPASVLSADDR
ncbi:MAG: GNAT family N-acetyltransferase, partial [Planctomycetes bacterium]|nr:GNAT family N-acetyltransferase [Planctomycetota bacterium]